MQKETDEGVDYCRRRVNNLKENIEAIGKVSSDFNRIHLFVPWHIYQRRSQHTRQNM